MDVSHSMTSMAAMVLAGEWPLSVSFVRSFNLSSKKKFALPFLLASSRCTACKPSCRLFTT